MATVTMLQATNMLTLPNAGMGVRTLGQSFGGYIEWDSNGSVHVLGTFSTSGAPPLIAGTISRVFVDAGDNNSVSNLEITGLSFSITAQYWLDLRNTGDMSQFVADLLSGNDTVIGTPQINALPGFDDDALAGFNGDDILIGGAGGDLLDGGSGSDTASYVTAQAGLFAGLEEAGFNTGDAAGDSYNSIENLTGSNFNDTLYGSTLIANRLSGGGGNDGLVGKGGADIFDGGAGTDTVFYDSSPAVRADLLSPSTNTGDAAGDTYISIENLEGSSFNDTLLGNNAANVIRGSHFPNLASGDDKMLGRDGNDVLFGHDGNDTLTGGRGKDDQTGGAGRDFFDFNSKSESVTGSNRDIIRDLSRADDDRINLSDIDADTSSNSGNDTFQFVGKAAFKGGGGELRYIDNGSTCYVQGDINGDKKADFEIKVNLAALNGGDFFL